MIIGMDEMKRYRVKMVAELQAETEDEAIDFLERVYGSVDPEPDRVLVLEVKCGDEVETPPWVAQGLARRAAAREAS